MVTPVRSPVTIRVFRRAWSLLRQIMDADPAMRAKHDEHLRKYERAKNAVNAKKLQLVPPVSPAKKKKRKGASSSKGKKKKKRKGVLIAPKSAGKQAKAGGGNSDESSDGVVTPTLCLVCDPPPTAK